MADEFVQFFESALIEKQVDTLTRTQLALLVLAGAAFRAAPCFGLGIKVAEFFQTVVVLAVFGQWIGCLESPEPR
jgi:hypothetical protein